MGYEIPYNRGVTESGPVHMVKSEPGVFYDRQGNIVSDEAAKAAGFDVERLVAERQVREQTADAEKAIRKRVSYEQAKRRGAANPPFVAKCKGGATWGVVHVNEPDNYLWQSAAGTKGNEAKAEAEAQAHDLCEALYREMAGYAPGEDPNAIFGSVPSAAAPTGSAEGGGGPEGGGGGNEDDDKSE